MMASPNDQIIVQQQPQSLCIEDNRTETPATLMAAIEKKTRKWSLLILNCTFTAIGAIGGPLLTRLYYLHGGTSKWLACLSQSMAFPIFLLPLLLLYMKARVSGTLSSSTFFIEPKLLFSSAVIGLLIGLDNYMYGIGLAYLPVSTSSLLLATQLVFTAGFAWIMVKQRFTPYSVNSVVLMTVGSALLGLRGSVDRPVGESGVKYYLGFFLTLGSALLFGLILPGIELSYAKASKTINYTAVLQFQLNNGLFASLFSLIGMLISKDFQEIPKEARSYELGKGKYCLVLAAGAIAWQLSFLGVAGMVLESSSLFCGVYISLLLPLTEVAAVIAFHEKFTGEKGAALALCLWGFASYFYGEYRRNQKERKKSQAQTLNHEVCDAFHTTTVCEDLHPPSSSPLFH